jgi:hypothetical protein
MSVFFQALLPYVRDRLTLMFLSFGGARRARRLVETGLLQTLSSTRRKGGMLKGEVDPTGLVRSTSVGISHGEISARGVFLVPRGLTLRLRLLFSATCISDVAFVLARETTGAGDTCSPESFLHGVTRDCAILDAGVQVLSLAFRPTFHIRLGGLGRIIVR